MEVRAIREKGKQRKKRGPGKKEHEEKQPLFLLCCLLQAGEPPHPNYVIDRRKRERDVWVCLKQPEGNKGKGASIRSCHLLPFATDRRKIELHLLLERAMGRVKKEEESEREREREGEGQMYILIGFAVAVVAAMD